MCGPMMPWKPNGTKSFCDVIKISGNMGNAKLLDTQMEQESRYCPIL